MKDKKKLFIIIGIVVLLLALIITCLLLKKKPSKVEEITITFNVDGGTAVDNIKIKKGTEIELPKTVKDGYNFLGWYIDEEKLEDKITLNEDKTITAKWEQIPEDAKTYTITFNSNGGTSVDKLTVECGKELTLPANPKKEGYTFISWVDQHETPILDQALLTCEDVTLYANWEKVEEKKEEKKEEKQETTQTEKPKEKKYTCPAGYELKDNNKCVSMKNPENYCPEGYTNSTVDKTVCYKYVKEPDKISCKNNGYYYIDNGNKFCGYEELASYTGSRERCQQAGGIFVQSNSHCFKRIEPGTNGNLNYGCNGIYSYRTQADLGSTQNGCFELKQREYGCKNAGEGYSMNYTTHNCVKTIDATLN